MAMLLKHVATEEVSILFVTSIFTSDFAASEAGSSTLCPLVFQIQVIHRLSLRLASSTKQSILPRLLSSQYLQILLLQA